MPLITSGPWDGVYNATDSDESFQAKLYSASNLYRAKGGTAWPTRPPFAFVQAAGTLGTGGGRYGQGVFEHVALDGTVYRFQFCGARMYRWDGTSTFTDVTPAGITISATARIYCATFADNLVVTDGVNKPWYVPSSGCSATPLVATNIQIDSTPSAWSAFGPPAVYDARLFFVVNTLAGVSFRDTVVWSEVANVSTGYKQTNYADFWELFQTDPRPIYGIAATEVSLVVLRAQSILCVTGKTDATFTTNATKESVEGVGTTTPASIVVHDGAIWFLDSLGRQYRYQPGSSPQPLWSQMADTVSALLRQGLANTPSTCGCAAYHPDLNLVLSASYAAVSQTTVANIIHAFDADSGAYLGVWDVDGAKFVHSFGVMRDASGHLSLVVQGESTSTTPSIGTGGQVWRLYTLGEMSGVSWQDPSGPISASILTHQLGRSEEGEWVFSEAALRAEAINAITSSRQLVLLYNTPRAQSGGLTSVLSTPAASNVFPGAAGLADFVGEARAVWGFGPNAQGRWFQSRVSGSSTFASAVQPFAPIAFELVGTFQRTRPDAP